MLSSCVEVSEKPFAEDWRVSETSTEASKIIDSVPITPSDTAKPTSTPTPSETKASESPKPSETPTHSETPTSAPSESQKAQDAKPDNNVVMIEKLNLPETVKNPMAVNYGSAKDSDGNYLTKSTDWYFGRNKNFEPPTAMRDFDFRTFEAYYLGDISERVIYLTFDEGYENGYTPAILDTLRDKGVKAAFFVTGHFIKTNPDLVIRMADEGHIIANHSNNHPDFTKLTAAEIIDELIGNADYCYEKTGKEMQLFFRPPEGKYSASVLNIVNELGYKTVFWSLAFGDWDPKNQPGASVSYQNTVNYVHNGCITLLHALSESNTLALPYIIDTLKANGFRFGSLDELSYTTGN